MPYLILRRSWRRFASILAFIALAGTLIYCAWSDYDNTNLSSFAPEVIHNDDYKPFFYTHDYFYGSPVFVQADFRESNTAEWSSFFDGKVLPVDIERLMYTGDSTPDYILPLIAFASGKTKTLPAGHKDNGVFKATDKKKQLEFLRYLYFARSCEPYATRYLDGYGWGDDIKDPNVGPAAEKDSLIADGQKLLKDIKTPFVRQRIYFQIVRMYFMTGDYGGCMAYFDAHRQEIERTGTSSIRYRSMSYAALSARRSNHFAMAGYLYSRVFDSCPQLRQNAMFYFAMREDSDWQQSLGMARTPHEKAVLWTMLGIIHLDEPRAIDEVYRLDPSSDLLDLLLVRAVNVSEGMNTSVEEPGLRPDTAYRHRTYSLLKRHMGDERLHNPALWSLSAGYLSDDMAEADQLYERALSQAHGDSLLIAQVHLLQVQHRVSRTDHIDSHTDSLLLQDMAWVSGHGNPLRTGAVYLGIRESVSHLYLQAHDTIMAQVALGHLWLDYFSRDSNAYRMIAFLESDKHTPLQTYLIGSYNHYASDMWYSLGMQDVYRGDLISARTKWMRAGSLTYDTLYADPFLVHIRDCHDCDQAAPQRKRYNRLNFLTAMIDLERTAKANKSKAAEIYYQMANGFYNISYTGNNRMFYSNSFLQYRNAAQLEGGNGYYDSEPAHGLPADSSHISGEEMALKYYLKARDASRDKEFKAKCTYMASKCEGYNYTESAVTDDDADQNYSPYFKELRLKYANTAYSRELVHECTYYRNYMAHFRR